MPGGVVKQDMSQHAFSSTQKKCFPEARGSVAIAAWR